MKKQISFIFLTIFAFNVAIGQYDYSDDEVNRNYGRNPVRARDNLFRPNEISTRRRTDTIENPSAAASASLPKILEVIENALKSKTAAAPINLNLIVVPMPEKDGDNSGPDKAGALTSLMPPENDILGSAESSDTGDSPAQGIIPTQSSQVRCKQDEEYDMTIKKCVPKDSMPAPVRGRRRRPRDDYI